MKKILFVLSITLACSQALQAQINVTTMKGSSTIKTVDMGPKEVQIIDGVATMHYGNSAAEINGSPYLTNEFIPGTMTALDGTEVPGLKYRYDIYGDKIQFLIDDDTAIINKPLALKSVVIGKQKFVYQVYMLKENHVATGYFEVIEDTEVMGILLRREIKLEQDVYVPNYGGGGGTKEFAMKEVKSFYVRPKGSAALKISNKKSFLNTVGEFQDEMKVYMKKNKLSVKKKKDLQTIANYYSTLVSSSS